jgi:hypothetical protein
MRGAREIDERRRIYWIRWSEVIERNEVAGTFSTACLQDDAYGAVFRERFQVENGFPAMDLQLSVHPF